METNQPCIFSVHFWHSYDTYGHMDQDRTNPPPNGYADEEISGFFQEQLTWKTEANNRDCAYIPGVTPGFNDRAVRLRITSSNNEAKALSRSIRPGAMEGSLLARLVEQSRPLLDAKADFLMALTSFNEFHEDTQIEPVVVDRMSRAMIIAADGTIQDLEAQRVTDKAYHIWNATRNGYLPPEVYKSAETDTDLTQGFFYEAYYDLYLNILRGTTIAPFYATGFQTAPPGGTLAYGASYTSNPTIEGTRSVKLVRTDPSNTPVLRLDLGLVASVYKYLVVEFMFYSERSEANEPLYVRCINSQGSAIVSEQKWEFGREYDQHRKAFYGVTECSIRDVPGNRNILIDFVYEAVDERTSMLIDSVKVTGLKEATDLSSTPVPTKAPTRIPTTIPTRAPTRIPTKVPTPTKAPTRAPTRIPTKIPTKAPVPTRAPTKAPTPIPTKISIQGTNGEISCQDFVVTIKTDSYPGDTGWELKKDGVVINSMTAGTYTVADQVNVHEWCLESGSYSFVLKDDPEYKDGLCCRYAIKGFYLGTLNGVRIFGNDQAEEFDVLEFLFIVGSGSSTNTIVI
jgi:hypothetical protein